MTIPWLNYQHLFYFWNVARCGSVTEASRRLRLAQPTISAQLKAFESVLGQQLLERKGRTIILTESGQLAFRYAEQIFSLGQELLDVLNGKSGKTPGELKIGISDVVPKSLAFKIIEPALNAESDCVVLCSEDKTERLLADLAIAEIDLVIADRPIPPNVKVKAYNHFIGECGISFLGAGPLARRLRKNFPRSLNSAPVLLPTSESALRNELDQWYENLSISPNIVAAFQDRALLKIAAREGRGIIPIPTAIEDEIKRDFRLELVGRVSEVKERFYLISTERKLKNPLIVQLCTNAKNTLFNKNK